MAQVEDVFPPVQNAVARPVATSRWLVVTLGVLAASGPFAIDMYLPAFPRIATELETTRGNVQWTLSVFLVGLAVGQISVGTLSDHVGRRGPLIAGFVLFAAAAAVCAGTHSIGTLIAARLLMGLGGSAGMVLSRAIVRDLFEEHAAARFFSLMMIIGGIGPIVAPFLGSLLLTHFTWRAVFWTVAGFGGVCAVAIACNVPETLPRERRARGHIPEVFRAYAHVLTHGVFLAHTLAIGLTAAMLFTYIASSPFVFIELYGVSPRTFSLLFATNAIGLYAAGQANRWLLGRFRSRAILPTAALINAAACAVLVALTAGHVGGFPVFFGSLFVCIGTLALIFPNATAVAMQPFGSKAGSASAMMGTLQFAIGAAAGGLVGMLSNGTELPMVGLMAAYSVGTCVILNGARVWTKMPARID